MRSCPSAARAASSPSGCATSTVRCPRSRRPNTVSSTWRCPPRQALWVSTCIENIRLPDSPRLPDSFSTRADSFSDSWLISLQFPELRELQHHVIRVHQGDNEPGLAVAKAAFEDVVAHERHRRVKQELEPRCAFALLEHLPRCQRRVAIHPYQMFR